MTRRRREGGFVTLEHIAVAAFGLVIVTWCANIVLLQYARAVTRLALDEGVRAAVVAGDVPDITPCQKAVDAALADLLGGSMGDNIEVACMIDGDTIRAVGSGTVPSWVPGMKTWPINVTAVATRVDLP